MNLAGYGSSFSGTLGQAESGGTIEDWKQTAADLWARLQAGEGEGGVSDLLSESITKSMQSYADVLANSIWKKAKPYVIAITIMMGIITISYLRRRD